MTTGPLHGLGRRRTLTGAAAIAVGLPVLAACGGSDTATDSSGQGTGSSSPSGGSGGTPGQELTTTADVPVGGGTIIDADKVVVTQPTNGDFKAFSSICTHQGCPVSSVADGTINCTCHGSKFSIEDGSVVQGPATRALDGVDITVKGDAITLA